MKSTQYCGSSHGDNVVDGWWDVLGRCLVVYSKGLMGFVSMGFVRGLVGGMALDWLING